MNQRNLQKMNEIGNRIFARKFSPEETPKPEVKIKFIPGPTGRTGRDGKNGRDGIEIQPIEVRQKLESLKGDDRLAIEHIRGYESSENIEKRIVDKVEKQIIYPNKRLIDQRWHGAGVTRIIAGTDITISSTGENGLGDVTINATPTSSQQVSNETPSGTINGINAVFTTANNFVPNSTHLYLNGIRQAIGGGNDYTETGANQITFVIPPTSGDVLIIDYLKM